LAQDLFIRRRLSRRDQLQAHPTDQAARDLCRQKNEGAGKMSVVVFERLIGDGLLRDAKFRDRLRRLPEPGRRILLWLLEQQDIERDIQADDNISRNQMKVKIAKSRKRPVGPLWELEETVIREAFDHDDGRIASGTLWRVQTTVRDLYFKPGSNP
jgi:hypothetical protein